MNKKLFFGAILILLVASIGIAEAGCFLGFIGNDCNAIGSKVSGVTSDETDDMDPIKIDPIGDIVKLSTRNKDGEIIYQTVFYTNSSSDDLKLGEDTDEQLIVIEGETLTAEEVVAYPPYELEDLEGTRFLYYFNEYSHFIEITNIDTVQNQTDFRIIDDASGPGIAYNDKDFIPEGITTFNFLSTSFQLMISPDNSEITFTNINDEIDGISKVETERGAVITLDEEESKVIIKEDNGGEIETYLDYDFVGMQIRISDLDMIYGRRIEGTTEWGTTFEGDLRSNGEINFYYPDY